MSIVENNKYSVYFLTRFKAGIKFFDLFKVLILFIAILNEKFCYVFISRRCCSGKMHAFVFLCFKVIFFQLTVNNSCLRILLSNSWYLGILGNSSMLLLISNKDRLAFCNEHYYDLLPWIMTWQAKKSTIN